MMTHKSWGQLLCAALLLLLGACQKPPQITMTTPATIDLSADCSGTITFTANSDWTASCPDSWIHVFPASGPMSKDPVTVTVRCDATYEDRRATITIMAEDAVQTVTVIQEVTETVDLGLSVKWRGWNLGATRPEEYGDYYAWGEVAVEKKDDYYWPTYKWCNGASKKLTKYCPADRGDYWDGTGVPDGKTVLDPEDDAAHVVLGGKWRMPTDEEWTEIRTQCTWTWTTLNGVNGYIVESKSNGNSIFLPAAGYQLGTHRGSLGSYGYYWSSSLGPDLPNQAWYVYFYSDLVDRGYGYRYVGFPVRPVTE